MNFYGQPAYPQIDSFSPIERRLPLSLAIAVHVMTFILLAFPPSFFMPDRDIPEVQTINLFTVEEFEQKTQPPKPQPARPQPAEDKAQSIAIEPPLAPAPPAEVISLQPRRVKKKAEKEPEPAPPKENTLRQKALERIQARVNQKVEDQKLKHDLSRLREALHSSTKETTPEQQGDTASPVQQETSSAPPSQGTSAQITQAERSYFIAVQRKILDNWALPETQDWNNTLETIVVIYIEKNGVISKTLFEKKSKNVYFNQYVEKTIQAAAPMPPIPAVLKKNRLEIGLRFRPSGLF
jgi:outer membrane biosynthesis protein TonB